MARRVRHRHHAVDHLLQSWKLGVVGGVVGREHVDFPAGLPHAERANAVCEANAHLDARFVDGDVVHHAVGTRQIDVFEDAGGQRLRERVDVRVQLHLHVDEERFSRGNVAFPLDSDRFQRDALRGRGELHDSTRFVAFHAEAQRTTVESGKRGNRMPWGSRKMSIPTPLISTPTA